MPKLCRVELNIIDTMISIYSVLFTLVLFSELNHLVTVAMPASKMEDGVTEQDGLGLILGDKPMTEHAVVPPMYRRHLVLDNNISDDDGNPKIIIVSVSVPSSNDKGSKGLAFKPLIRRMFQLPAC